MTPQFSRPTSSTGSNAPTDPDHRTPPEKEKLVSFSPAQILGGALAAMTAAALGSRLGVGGTIIGAALASIIAAVAGSLYTASIRASQQRVATVMSRTRSPRSSAPTTITEAFSETPAEIAEQKRGARRGWWKGAAIGAVAAFAVAAVALTSFELFTGNAISGGDGTTITQVGRDASGGSGDPTPTATTTETVTQSAEPSESASAAATPSESATESTTPTETASATPSESPSASPTPSSSETPSAAPSNGSDSTSGTQSGTAAEGVSNP